MGQFQMKTITDLWYSFLASIVWAELVSEN